jgi:phage shock protein PspC (stress-responsive transcriptional regulator)
MDTLHRSDTDRILGGVCAGLAEKFGGSPWLYRVAFIVGTIATQGVLAIVYLLLWAFLPTQARLESGERRARVWDRTNLRERAGEATDEMRQRMDQAREYVQRMQSETDGTAPGSKPMDRLQKQAFRVADDAVSAYQRWRAQQTEARSATDEVIDTTTVPEPRPIVEAPQPGPERQAEEPK